MRFKLYVLLGILVTLSGCATAPIEPSAADIASLQSAGIADDTNVIVIVETEQAANQLAINAARGGYQLTKKTVLSGLKLIVMDFERPKGISGTVAVSDMKKMEPSAVAAVDAFYSVQTNTETTISDARHYAADMIHWPQKGCPAHRKVGMIDGTIDAEAFASDLINARSFTKNLDDNTAHATAIASLLIGPGRLRETELYGAAVIANNQPGAGLQEVVNALNWMLEENVSIVNISLAGPYNSVLERVINAAVARGMVIIAAAGNDGANSQPLYPAAFNNVIAVTAIDAAQEIYAEAVQGQHIDFAAPGVDVFVDTSNRYLSGTSIAAPFVTALIASDARLNNEAKVKEVREHVARAAIDLGGTGHDPVFGAGLVRQSGSCTP